MTLTPEIPYKTYTVRVETPDGVMFVHIIENEAEMPIQVLINIGKTGTNLAAWADAVARLTTRLLPKLGISGVIEEISGITSDRLQLRHNGEVVRSGPEGLAVALLKYYAEWHREHRPKPRYGGPSVNP